MKKKLYVFVITLILITGMTLFGSVAVFADTGPGDVTAAVDVINGLAAYSTVILGVLGALTFFVQLVVHCTKKWPLIRRIPTDLWVFIVSIIICELVLFIYAAWANLTVFWYYIVLAAFMAFAVSFIAMYGWSKLNNLYLRYAKRKE